MKLNKKTKIIFLIILSLVVIAVGVFFYLSNVDNEGTGSKTLNNKMEKITTEFYNENIKGKVIGVNKQIVTLKDLKKQNYDISDFERAKCDLESFAYVIIKDPQETDKAKIKFTIENHLKCGK